MPTKPEELTHKLMSTSCAAMCDGEAWSRSNHKLVVDCIDAYKAEIRTLKTKDSEPRLTVRHFS